MNNYLEAVRYLENAKRILSENAKKEDGFYQDRKYVKMAGHTAYAGVLVALDEVLGKKGKGRKSVEWYQAELAKLDRKMTNTFNSIYDILHLSMSYDGVLNAKVIKIGLDDAEKIINWTQTRTSK